MPLASGARLGPYQIPSPIGEGRTLVCDLLRAVFLSLISATPSPAQSSGSLEGRVTDEQGLPLANVAVVAKNTATGFARSTICSESGRYQLSGLTVGLYDVASEVTGFARQSRRHVGVSVAATTTLNFEMSLTPRTEDVTVAAEAPLIDVKQSGISEIVTQTQINNLPLNGRQFGNLAALVPGVGLGAHNDPTKAGQFTPQVGGGTGRNINYLVDGGDNNDDTVGGLVQSFPLDSIAEFNFMTHRFKAEYGRSDGGVLNVVTKSGTNDLSGSAFGFFRNRSLNARTQTELSNDVPKGDYNKFQYGGSLGGPIRKDKVHFFLSFERNRQDTTQPVDTGGLFPEKDGVFPVRYREGIFVGKVTSQIGARHNLSLRYAFNANRQPYGARPQSPPEAWGDNRNTFHSANLGLVSSLGAGHLNEFLSQFSYYLNDIEPNSTLPSEYFPSGVAVGQNEGANQRTWQKKWHFRDDFTWSRGRHELKAGAVYVHEPRLASSLSNTQPTSFFVHLEDALDSLITEIGTSAGGPQIDGNVPNEQYAAYVQDTWRLGDRLVLDIGLRYDIVTGLTIDQSTNPVFQDLQGAARAGRLRGIEGLEDFGTDPAVDRNNVAPRLGFTYDVGGQGRLIVRGGVGRYYDFPYSNANVLIPLLDAQHAFGFSYYASDSDGLRNPDGSFYRIGQPLPPRQTGDYVVSYAAAPHTRQPYTDQVNLGFSRVLGRGFAVELDGLLSRGLDMGQLLSLNVLTGDDRRRFGALLPNVGTLDFTVFVPRGRNTYRGVTAAIKKRWDGRLQLLGSYTLSEATANVLPGTDEFAFSSSLFDAYHPYSRAPVATDARHRVTISGVYGPGAGFTIAPIFRFRSSLPYTIEAGRDLNQDGINFDLPPGVPTGNAGRGARFSQLDVRIAKTLRLGRRGLVELIAECFNVFNARNPDGFSGNQTASNFGQPTSFAGDTLASEQRLAQLGLRIRF
jgi:hypothetical protein